ncbi:MAG: uroporphyrinogen-III synthase [Rhodoferax sp.]|uniref:uroporphyrinogen-III synthase n=1 Tax=Rhodoferax sp. TaxID=50421 RepID=UPI002726C402|nr:uroporphyrinogen-III synthase [Rhodoferax sp.]MDO8449829.1 uroporphyrinogen-III synthase [Rhodoferax sp.]
MRVIVTRPEREAQRWVRDLSAHGLDAVALPLIQVGPVDDPADLVQAWRHLAEYVGVMFVSGNAVEHFFASKPPLAPEFSAQAAIKTRAWATGPGTARALLREGVAPDRLDVPALDAGQFDSEALWQVVGAQVHAGDRVLIVRGGDAAGSGSPGQGTGREWFANRVAQAGARADFVVAYQRYAPQFSAHECELARQAATDGAVWLLSSTEAVANLSAWLPGQSWSRARAVATHPRIAAAARMAGFGVVCESRPTLPDVVASIESMR